MKALTLEYKCCFGFIIIILVIILTTFNRSWNILKNLMITPPSLYRLSVYEHGNSKHDPNSNKESNHFQRNETKAQLIFEQTFNLTNSGIIFGNPFKHPECRNALLMKYNYSQCNMKADLIKYKNYTNVKYMPIWGREQFDTLFKTKLESKYSFLHPIHGRARFSKQEISPTRTNNININTDINPGPESMDKETISNTKQTIYYGIPKCASTSTYQMLNKINFQAISITGDWNKILIDSSIDNNDNNDNDDNNNNDDDVNRNYFLSQKEMFLHPIHNNIDCGFTFVRHPITRLIAAYQTVCALLDSNANNLIQMYNSTKTFVQMKINNKQKKMHKKYTEKNLNNNQNLNNNKNDNVEEYVQLENLLHAFDSIYKFVKLPIMSEERFRLFVDMIINSGGDLISGYNPFGMLEIFAHAASQSGAFLSTLMLTKIDDEEEEEGEGEGEKILTCLESDFIIDEMVSFPIDFVGKLEQYEEHWNILIHYPKCNGNGLDKYIEKFEMDSEMDNRNSGAKRKKDDKLNLNNESVTSDDKKKKDGVAHSNDHRRDSAFDRSFFYQIILNDNVLYDNIVEYYYQDYVCFDYDTSYQSFLTMVQPWLS